MLIWCMKCRKKQSVEKPYFVKTKFNKYLVKGICPICNCKMSSLIKKEHYIDAKK